jgi:Rod binding domain-containing protein
MSVPVGMAAAAAGGDQALEAARGLEAFFVRRVLGEVKALGGAMGSGVAASTFRDMLVEQLGDSIAGSGQIGLAETLAAQMSQALGGVAQLPTGADAGAGERDSEQALLELVSRADPARTAPDPISGLKVSNARPIQSTEDP